ncbi:MAG: bifunctional glutamate N-acetyltransferase/amino-acid acetyltransferase ArgJ [Planctomycetota bacterium]|nr:bifunctional glutamate N-acetyltransferase/amino-acid acetyltransferase ArgJ [Planctomycetota bacterium]
MAPIRHITLPAGFVANGVACGVKASGKEDLAIIASTTDAAAAVVTTQNQVVGAPVLRIRRLLPKGYGTLRGVVSNSGVSNVATGAAGVRDADTMGNLTARLLGTTGAKVLAASTGVIGHRLPMDKIRRGIAAAAAGLGPGRDTNALRAMMTTDTREKYAVVQTRLGGKTVTLAGVVKGSGMISPCMATMIGVLTTDAAIAPSALHKALKQVVPDTFNAVTVDSDTSTSDTVVALANGAAGNKTITAGSADFAKFVALLHEVCYELSYALAADGEGATKVVEIAVVGARSDAEAAVAAKSVANSPLFKCAIHGGDPNWGRIVAALGKSSAKVNPETLSVRIGGVCVFSKGTPCRFNLKKVEAHLGGKDIKVGCDLGLGKGKSTALTCDFSREYITINADYHT